MKRVLILCTGNSCRSQIAEVILNKMGQGQFEAVSAGAKPSGYVHPLALRVLSEMNYSTEGLRSKSVDEFKDKAFDTVITVCDRAKEACPVWPGAEMLHWSFEDPANVKGTDEDKLVEFRKTAMGIQQRVMTALQQNQDIAGLCTSFVPGPISHGLDFHRHAFRGGAWILCSRNDGIHPSVSSGNNQHPHRNWPYSNDVPSARQSEIRRAWRGFPK